MAARADGEVILGGGGPEADLGSAVHYFLSQRIAGRPFDPADIAKRYGLQASEVAPMCWWAWKSWKVIAEHFPAPEVEMPVGWVNEDEGITITGRIDLVSIVGNQGRLLDWKSGILESDAEQQLRGYAFVLSRKFPEMESVYAAVLNIRSESLEGWTWTRDELDTWMAEMLARLKDERYRPGAHCRFCPRAATCPAVGALIRRDATAMLDFEEDQLPTEQEELGPFLGDMLIRARFIEATCKRVVKLIHARVAAAGGTLPTGDGRALVIKSEPRSEILVGPGMELLFETLAPLAHKLLRAGLSNEGIVAFFDALSHEALSEVLEFSKTALEKAVRDQAADRQKAAAWREFLLALDEAGAIRQKEPVQKLQIRKLPARIEAKA